MNTESTRQSFVHHSLVYSNTGNPLARSFISTALVRDSLAYGDELRKSRIQNLPNYKKTNLGQTTNFVIVFQTIQIERLSNQVQLLRVKLKQYQRQIFNTQNYQVQIRQLTQKCFAYQTQTQQYRQQLQKLNKICETLYHENSIIQNQLKHNDFSLKQKYQSQRQKNTQLIHQIQKWKARYQAAQKSKIKQLQDIKNLMECQRKSMIDRQIRENTIRFQNQRSNLQSQIRKARQLLQNKNKDLELYKQKSQKYQIQLLQSKQFQNIINQNQNKIIILNQQLLRLNEVLKNKEDDIQSIRQKQYKLNQMLKDQKQWQYQNQLLKTNLEVKESQIQQWRVKFSRLQNQIARTKQQQHYNKQLVNKLNLSSRQIERLNNLLKSKLEQIQQWAKRLTDKQIQLSKYKNLQNQVARYQSKHDMIETENNRLNGILKTRLSQIQDWKNKCLRLQSNSISYLNGQKQRKSLQQKFNKQIKQIQQLKFQLEKNQQKINNLKKIQSEAKDFQGKNLILNKEIDRLNSLVKNGSHQFQDLKFRYNKIQNILSQYKNIETQKKDYQTKIILLTQQIQRLNSLIRNKNQDINQLEMEKLQIHKKVSFYKSYEQKINQYQQSINKLEGSKKNLQKNIQNWQIRFKQLDIRCRQLENNLFLSTQEKEKLSSMIKNKNTQYETIRSKYAQMEDNISENSHYKMVCQQQHKSILVYNADLQKFQHINKNLQNQLSFQKNINNQFAYKIIVLSLQIQRLSNGGYKNSKEMLQIQQKYSKILSKQQLNQKQIQNLTHKINSLENQVTQLRGQYNRLLREFEKSQNENILIQQKIDAYQDYARKIHILGAQIDRLTIQNKLLDQDAKKMRLKYSNNIQYEKKQQYYSLSKVLMAIQIQALRKRSEERQLNMQQIRKSILQPIRKI